MHAIESGSPGGSQATLEEPASITIMIDSLVMSVSGNGERNSTSRNAAVRGGELERYGSRDSI